MNRLFQTLSLGLVVFLASCSQDRGNEELLTTATEKIQAEKVNLTIDAEVDDENLRSLSGTFSKDNNWKPVITKLQKGQKVNLNLVFSDGKNVSYQNNLVFTVVNDEGKLSFSGDINISNYSTARAWYVTAIYGGAYENNKYGYAPQMYELGESVQEFKIGTGNGALNIPYMSGWTRVTTAVTAERKTISVFNVKLRPQGYLLRLKLKNKRDHKLSVRRFLSANDDILFNADFSLDTNSSALQAGAYPVAKLRPNGNHDEGNGRYIGGGAGVDLDRGDTAPTESKTYLVWVMPNSKLTTSKEFTLNAIHYKQGAEWIFPFKITLQPGTDGVGGISSLKTLNFPNDHKPYRTLYDIDYIAKGNMKADGSEAAEGEVGYNNTWAHYNTRIRKNANIRKHGDDMTSNNWLALLPRSGTQNGVYYDGGSATDGYEFFSSNSGSAVTGTVGSNFRLYDNGPISNYYRSTIGTARILYAVRDMPTSQSPGKKGAFRYELSRNGNLLIEMVHLQSNLNISKTINDVNNEAYWATARQYGEVVKRLFPGGTGISLSRSNNNNGTIESTSYYYVGVDNDNPAGTLWNYGISGGAGRIGIGLAIGNDTNIPGTTALRKVRLKKKEVQSLHANPKQ